MMSGGRGIVRSRREVHAAQKVLKTRVGAQGLSQLCVFCFGFLQDGGLWVGVFHAASRNMREGFVM
jgi:hypothetical protein